MPKNEGSTRAEVGTYKGQPTISLDADSKWPFTFGLRKAQLILEHIDAIEAFVEDQGRQEPEGEF
jgi:hypothetical protein